MRRQGGPTDCAEGAGAVVSDHTFVMLEQGIDRTRLRVALCTGASADDPACATQSSSLQHDADLVWSQKEPFTGFDESRAVCTVRYSDHGLERTDEDSITVWWREWSGTLEVPEAECTRELAEEGASACTSNRTISAARVAGSRTP